MKIILQTQSLKKYLSELPFLVLYIIWHIYTTTILHLQKIDYIGYKINLNILKFTITFKLQFLTNLNAKIKK